MNKQIEMHVEDLTNGWASTSVELPLGSRNERDGSPVHPKRKDEDSFPEVGAHC
jgi:hypothetical protein